MLNAAETLAPKYANMKHEKPSQQQAQRSYPASFLAMSSE
jgi:hypothetical protein